MSGQPRSSPFLDRVFFARQPDETLIDFAGTRLSTRELVKFACLDQRDRFAGKNVLIAPREPLDCALALLELDSVAHRLVVCPPNLSQSQLEEIARTAETEFLITDAGGTTIGLPGVKRVEIDGLKHLRQPLSIAPQPTEWVLLTSGTTGTPKLVRHSFESLTTSIRKPDTGGEPIVWASFNDMRRFSGLQMFLHALLTDSKLVLKTNDVAVSEFLPILAAAGATHVSGTPTHWRKVLMFEGRKQLNLKQVTLVGEIADQPILDALKRAFPMARLTHIFGSTESGTGFSVHDGEAGFPAHFVDRDLKGLTLRVDNGALKVKSTRAALDYVGDVSSPLREQDGFIDTGDQVELVGDRYRFLGRRNGAVNIGGSRVHPEEVEAALNAHPLISMSAVSAKKSPFTGAILVADVVLKSDGSRIPADLTALSNSMMADLKTRLEPYKVPAIIRFVDDLNLSAAGKLDRKSA
jgi:acyl-coenzyme A synthetase/AMP-(fatty) acid ligase